MTFLQAMVLGLIQGATEFIPISSSGHLVLVPYFLGWNIPEKEAFAFDVLVQTATILAVSTFFWSDIKSISRGVFAGLKNRSPFHEPRARLGWFLLAASIPAGVLGLLFKKSVENAFNSPTATALFLLGTAALLLFAERIGKRNRSLETLTWKDALWIGFFQALAVYPGISRSGATITGGMTRGFDRPSAARFSFLMSVPIMLAAGLLALVDLVQIPGILDSLPSMSAGFVTAGITGYLSIRWLLTFLIKHPISIFAIYCALLGTVTLITLQL